MNSEADLRVAMLIPLAPRAKYWNPLLAEFGRRFPRTTVFSCVRSEVPPPYRDAFSLRYAGSARQVELFARGVSPGISVTLLPVGIVVHILRLRPHVIFTSGFNLWSVLSLLMGALLRIKIVVIYDGSSPRVDFAHRSFRIALRRAMAQHVDAFVTNTQAGAQYLSRALKVEQRRIFSRPYLVPSTAALSSAGGAPPEAPAGSRRPVFLFVGRVSYLKGFASLLKACALLAERGHRDFILRVVGTGPEGKMWKEHARRLGIEDIVVWEGWIEYGRLGAYYESADVFVFPTLSDVWGMVVLEAMVFGKPVICSRCAGASEVVAPGENGFLVDPHRPDEIAETMERFINEPTLARTMGGRARELLVRYQPPSAVEGLSRVVTFVTATRHVDSSSRIRMRHHSCRSH